MHVEILRRDQEAVLNEIGSVATENGFYLAGGTALALHLGHRRSEDFDWFTETSIEDPKVLETNLRKWGLSLTAQQVSPGTLHGVINDVHVSFLEYRYPLLKVAVEWPDFHCRLADVADICCMKLAAIAHRGARKDFLDIYSIANATRWSLPQMLDLYQEKYNTDDVASVVYGLSYFQDAEEDEAPEMLHSISWIEVKREVANWVARFH
jgi:hypothetical protein